MSMATMNSALWRSNHNQEYVLALHGKLNPADADWDQYCGLVAKTVSPQTLKGLTITLGAGPNAKQRSTITTIHKEFGVAPDSIGAVVTDSALVRGVITALTWAGIVRKIRAFPLRDLNAGFTYVGVDEAEHAHLIVLLTTLGEKIDDGNPMLALRQHAKA